jgi:GDP-4-dehydro-6-deoxy-D-mannose reductase
MRITATVRPDEVYHLAGLTSGEVGDLYRVNILGTVHLLEAVRTTVPQAAVLVVGSAAEYGPAPPTDMPLNEQQPCRPEGPYGISKYAATLTALCAVRQHGLRVVVVRPFNLVGVGISPNLVVGAVLKRVQEALRNSPQKDCTELVIAVGNLDTARDFLPVGDAVDAYVRLLRAGCWGEVFNVCSGQPRTVRSVLEELLSFSPRPVRLQVEPGLVRPSDVPLVYGSYEKAAVKVGFRPTGSLREALRTTWDHAMQREQTCAF